MHPKFQLGIACTPSFALKIFQNSKQYFSIQNRHCSFSFNLNLGRNVYRHKTSIERFSNFFLTAIVQNIRLLTHERHILKANVLVLTEFPEKK